MSLAIGVATCCASVTVLLDTVLPDTVLPDTVLPDTVLPDIERLPDQADRMARIKDVS